jgi:hypothetical protein
MPLLEIKDCCCVEERQTVHLGKDVRGILIVTIHGSNPIHFVQPPVTLFLTFPT